MRVDPSSKIKIYSEQKCVCIGFSSTIKYFIENSFIQYYNIYHGFVCMYGHSRGKATTENLLRVVETHIILT